MIDTKRELEFIGCAGSAKFLYEKVESAADRGYGVLVEPVGGESNRAFNLYQVTPALAKAASDMYEALLKLYEEVHEMDMFMDEHNPDNLVLINNALQALAKAEGK